MIVFFGGGGFAITLQYNQTRLLWHCFKRQAPHIKFTHLLKLQVAALSLGPSSRSSCSHQTGSRRDLLPPSKTHHRVDGRSANLASGWGRAGSGWGPLTGHLRHHCLRDPPVPQERFDLLLHHAAVPPASKHTHTHTQLGRERERERRRTRALREPRGDFETKAFSKTPLFWMD